MGEDESGNRIGANFHARSKEKVGRSRRVRAATFFLQHPQTLQNCTIFFFIRQSTKLGCSDVSAHLFSPSAAISPGTPPPPLSLSLKSRKEGVDGRGGSWGARKLGVELHELDFNVPLLLLFPFRQTDHPPQPRTNPFFFPPTVSAAAAAADNGEKERGGGVLGFGSVGCMMEKWRKGEEETSFCGRMVPLSLRWLVRQNTYSEMTPTSDPASVFLRFPTFLTFRDETKHALVLFFLYEIWKKGVSAESK